MLVRPVDWQELVKLCEGEKCRHDRTKGDHIIMVRPGMARPVVIPKKRGLKEDIVLGIARTLGISKDAMLEKLSGAPKKSRKNKPPSATPK
jgi:hypothetical protein